MLQQTLKSTNPKIICGIDEAGRGAFAGPLVAAAVVVDKSIEKKLQPYKRLIKDSKLLDRKKRNLIYRLLKKLKTQMQVEIISARRINNRGIGRANKECIRNLIKRIDADEYIVDGNLKLGRINGKTHLVRTQVDADAIVLPTILAGIVAKVERDKIMRKLHLQFPRFHWRSNVGYGTTKHLQSIIKYNLTYYHRLVYVTTAFRNKARGLES